MADESMRFEIHGNVAAQLVAGINGLNANIGQLTRHLAGTERQSRQTGRATRDTGDQAAAAVLKWQSLGHAMDMIGRQVQAMGRSMEQLGSRSLRVLQRGVDNLVRSFSPYEQQLQNAITVTGLMGDAFDQARDEMFQFGLEASLFSAKTPAEIAESFYALGSAGLSVAEQMAASTEVVALAEATMATVPEVAELGTSSMKAFGLAAGDMGRITNAMAATISSSRMNIERLSYSLPYAATAAKGFNLSIEETLTYLAAMVDRGLQATMAGTGFRSMLAKLTDVSNEAERALKRLGLTVDDVSIKQLGMGEVLQRLQDAGAEYSDMLQIVGLRAVNAADILVQQAGPAMAEFEASITGTNRAAEMQAKQLETLTGQYTILRGSIEMAKALITEEFAPALSGLVVHIRNTVNAMAEGGVWRQVGESLRSAMESFVPLAKAAVDAVSGLLTAFDNLSPGMQKFLVVGTAVSGLLLVLGGRLMTVVGSILALGGPLAMMYAAFSMLSVSSGLPAVAAGLQSITGIASLLVRRLGFVGLAIGAVTFAVRKNVLGLGSFVESIEKTIHVARELDEDIYALSQTLQDLGMAAELAQEKAVDLTGAYDKLRESVSSVRDALNDVVDTLINWTTSAPEGVTWTGLLEGAMDGLRWVLDKVALGLESVNAVAIIVIDSLRFIGRAARDATILLKNLFIGEANLLRGTREGGLAEGLFGQRYSRRFGGRGELRPATLAAPMLGAGGGGLGAQGLTWDEFQGQLRAGEQWRRDIAAGLPEVGPVPAGLQAPGAGGGDGGGDGGGEAARTAAQIEKDANDAMLDRMRRRQDLLNSIAARQTEELARREAGHLVEGIGEVARIARESLLANIQLMLGRIVPDLPTLPSIPAMTIMDIRRLAMFARTPEGARLDLAQPGMYDFGDTSRTAEQRAKYYEVMDRFRRRAALEAARAQRGEAAAASMLWGRVTEGPGGWAREAEVQARRLGDALLYAAQQSENIGAAFANMGKAFVDALSARMMEGLLEPIFRPISEWIDKQMEDMMARMGKGKEWAPGVGAMAGSMLGGSTTGATVGAMAGSFLGPWGAVAGGLLGGFLGPKDDKGQAKRRQEHAIRQLEEMNQSLRSQNDFFRSVAGDVLFGPVEGFLSGRLPGSRSDTAYVLSAARGPRLV